MSCRPAIKMRDGRAVLILADFNVMDCGTIYILNTQTDAAREWVAEHIPDDAQTFGQCGTVVEHRYIGEIVAGIQRDGLTVD